MAKIKCSDCGKKFDYEIHSGMCPKCGTYTRIDKEVNKESSPDLTRMEKTSVVEKKAKPILILAFLMFLIIAFDRRIIFLDL